jgi:hypothetical protein
MLEEGWTILPDLWTATHDKGWTTGVTENPDGTYAAWVTRETTGPVTAAYVEDTPENAMRAADYAVAEKTGHRQCSSASSRWSGR